MSAIRPETAILRGAAPIDEPARTGRVGPSVGRILASFAVVALGLCLGLVAGIVLVLATGLVAFC